MAKPRLAKRDRELFAQMEEALDSLDEAPYRDYWAALGQFIHTFSSAEHKLLLLLRKYAGIILSGVRGEQATTWVRALLDAGRRKKVKDRLESPLAQFVTINTIRNNIVHWGARYDRTKKYLLVSNRRLTPVPSKRKEFPISVPHLELMIADLRHIIYLFDAEFYGYDSDSTLSLVLRRSWLYKPPQPSRSPKKLHPGPKGQKPPRPS